MARLLLVLMPAITVLAQQPKFLAPQPHKLLYADTIYNKALKEKDTLLLAEAYYLYGKTSESTGDLITSERWFLRSLRLLEPRGDSPELSRIYNRLGGNKLVQRNYKTAHRYVTLAIAVARRTGSGINLDRSYGSMANIHDIDWSEEGKKPDLPKPRRDSVLYYYNKILQLAERDQDSLRIAFIYQTLGSYHWRYFNDREDFLSYSKKALVIFQAKKKDREIMDLLLNLANHYLDTGEFDTAWKVLGQARDIYNQKKYNVFLINQNFEESFTRYYRLTGNWKRAFEHNEKLRNLQVSTYLADRDLAFSRLWKEYEAEKKDVQLRAKDTELALRSSALKAQQRFTIAMAILLLATALMSIIFFRLYKKNKRISEQNEVLVREQNHRVKNNLQAVSSLLSLQSDALTDPTAIMAIEESRLRVETMAILHRKLYDGKRLAQVYVPDFLDELVESVLDSYGYEDVQLNIEADVIYLSADKAVHLGLILNELITNACKYAFPENEQPTLFIECRELLVGKQPCIQLQIADNGKKYSDFFINTRKNSPANMQRKGSGFGLRLIKMESDQLYGVYHFTYENGTVFRMNFPKYKNEVVSNIAN
ncbi:sensor histidine kinase [Dyadobacter psychrophilus]|uniref:histidine kinase n=1 Tax=Dyadobacter psychrophilus TaxID=651661 RepID=A0A1T5DZL8_9BACT|nr:sensor histidine kinase [Dyadobacter psychrophilus]SKB76916.1 Two-component sensor histidine kinase, contains HisKA and HATPase domains [Dyadobacter psychrophilus]